MDTLARESHEIEHRPGYPTRVRRQTGSLIRRVRRQWRWIVPGLLTVMLACWPVTTRYGIDHVPHVRRVTLLEKSAGFVSRDLRARWLATSIVRGLDDPVDRTMRVFSW